MHSSNQLKVIQQTLIESFLFPRDCLHAGLTGVTEAGLAKVGSFWEWQINLEQRQCYDVWGWITLCWGGAPVLYSVEGLAISPPSISCIPVATPLVWQAKVPTMLPNIPCRTTDPESIDPKKLQ